MKRILQTYWVLLLVAVGSGVSTTYSAADKKVMEEDAAAREQVARQRRLEEFQQARAEEDVERRKKKGVLPAQLEIEEGSAAAVQSLGGPEEQELQQAIAMSLEPQEKPGGTKKTAKAQEERKEEDEKRRAKDLQTYRKNLADAEREQAAARARRGGHPVEYSDVDIKKLVGTMPTTVGELVGPFLFREPTAESQGEDIIPWRTLDISGSVSSELALSPDGKFVFAGIDGKIHSWDLATGKLVRTFTARRGQISSLAMSGDGKFMVSAHNSGLRNGSVLIWNVQKGTLLHTFNYNMLVQQVAINRHGSIIATHTHGGSVRIIDVRSETIMRELFSIRSVAMSADGSLIAIGQEGFVSIENINSGYTAHKLAISEQQWTYPVMFSATNNFIVIRNKDPKKGVSLWEIPTGRLIGTLPSITKSKTVAMSEDETWLFGASDENFIGVWSMETGKLGYKLLPSQERFSSIQAVALSKDGGTIVGVDETFGRHATVSSIYIWKKNVESKKLLLYARRGHLIDKAEKLRDQAKAIRQFPVDRLRAINAAIASLKSADIKRKEFEKYIGKISDLIKKEFMQGMQESIGLSTEFMTSALERAGRIWDFPEELKDAIGARVKRFLGENRSQPDFAMRANEAAQEVERLFQEGLEEIRRQNIVAPVADIGGMGGVY